MSTETDRTPVGPGNRSSRVFCRGRRKESQTPPREIFDKSVTLSSRPLSPKPIDPGASGWSSIRVQIPAQRSGGKGRGPRVKDENNRFSKAGEPLQLKSNQSKTSVLKEEPDVCFPSDVVQFDFWLRSRPSPLRNRPFPRCLSETSPTLFLFPSALIRSSLLDEK